MNATQWQVLSYELTIEASIETYLLSILTAPALSKHERDQMWELSQLLEPRERPGETMSRLLKESGFL